jgi:lon-related putative ATP-dependent protease
MTIKKQGGLKMSNELKAAQLMAAIDKEKLDCKSTEDLRPLTGLIGQDRAVKALKFGLNIENKGFNIFVSGYTGTGRTTGIKQFVEEMAKTKPVPSDWCYVNNFENSYEPYAIELPAGRGKEFQNAIRDFISSVREQIPKVFKSDDYIERKNLIINRLENEKTKVLEELNKKAREKGLAIKSTQIGLLIIPVIDGKIISEEEFLNLSEEKKKDFQAKRDLINEDMKKSMANVRDIEKKIMSDLSDLDHEVALYTIQKFLDDIKDEFKDSEVILKFIDELKEDILKNITLFSSSAGQAFPGMDKSGTAAQAIFPWIKDLPFKKYEVNLIVDNSNLKGAPVVMEQNPTYQNLFGRVEKEAQLGVLTTDFSMIRAGAMHHANNGYLVIPVEGLFKNIFSWDSLKTALKDKEIKIEEASERLGYMSTKSLKPEPIPLKIKIILIGNPYFFNLLYMFDEEFKKLFKVKADFDTVMEKNQENIKKYAAFMCTVREKEKLKHLDSSAIARIIEYGSRVAENKEKVTIRFLEITDLIMEANFYAEQDDEKYINERHVQKAINEKIYRSDIISEKIRESIKKGTILIDTKGTRVGQVNGLSVINLGELMFGHPSRVTVSIGLGKEGIVDIERETKMGGPIHTKGVLILSGYIVEKFAREYPLNLAARIVFEQNYGFVEGDSASSTELYALLSALSGLPLRQDIAVTGSVNQKGDIQAIGGVNAKIEGFFHVCKETGLTGSQGVIIPESNVRNLMLKEEVVDAVKKKKFHVYAIKRIDEGIELLSGKKAGKMLEDGTFEEGSVFDLAQKTIKQFSEKYRHMLKGTHQGS